MQMQAMCARANAVSRMSKKYDRACKLLQLTTRYLQTPFYLPCVVKDFNENELMLCPLDLHNVKRSQRHLTYSSLALTDKPSVCVYSDLDVGPVHPWI